MKRAEVSRATLGRIPSYLEYLKNINRHTGNISATTLAKELGLGEVQVRKDLGAVSGAGRPKTGYPVEQLIEELEAFLGCGKKRDNVVIVGAGKLGEALEQFGQTHLPYGALRRFLQRASRENRHHHRARGAGAAGLRQARAERDSGCLVLCALRALRPAGNPSPV